MSQEQEKTRQQAATAAKVNEKRITDINQVQENLKQEFIDVNDFIQNCEMKEQNALKKVRSN